MLWISLGRGNRRDPQGKLGGEGEEMGKWELEGAGWAGWVQKDWRKRLEGESVGETGGGK